MKTCLQVVSATAATLFTLFSPQFSGLFAQDTAFTYQGKLTTNGAPFTGSAEFQFTLWDAATNGTAIATNIPSSNIASVDDGLFTVTLDFGINPFSGEPRFLQTEVRTGIGPFTTLAPRQPVTATPYALRALNLTTNGLAGTYGNAVTFDNAGNSFAGTLTGTAIGDGSGLVNVNAATLDGLSSSNFWVLGGNAGANPTNGAFLGTTDNLPLEFKVNGHRVLRLEPDSSGGLAPNIIAGRDDNSISSGLTGSVIGGGDANNIRLSTGEFSEQGSVIAGGVDNLIGGTSGGGSILLVGGLNVVGGGHVNNIRANANFSVVGGGEFNLVPTNSQYATIPGGDQNSATNHAFAAGHRAKANHNGAFVWADSQNVDFASTAANQFLIRASGGVGINTANPVGDLHVNGPIVIEGPALAPGSTASSNLINLMVGGGSSPVATNGSLNGISFYEGASAKSMSLGYDGSGSSSQNALRIYNNSDAGLFTFQANGRMGVGTNNPQQALHVVGNILATGTVSATAFSGNGSGLAGLAPASGSASYIQNQTAADQTAGLRITGNGIFNGGRVGIGTPSPSRELEVQNTGDTEIGIKSTDANGHLWTLQSSAVSGNVNLDGSFQIIDRTLNGSRLLIRTNGDVGIGTSSPDARLHVAGGTDASLSGGGFIVAGSVSGANVAIDSNEIMARNNGGAATLNLNFDFPTPQTVSSTPGIIFSGNMVPKVDGEQFLGSDTKAWRAVESHLYETVSDARLKKDILPLHYGLETVLSLRPVSFRWKELMDDRLNLGLVAQEVEAVVPEAVSKPGNPEQRLAINYNMLVSVLIKAVQEQQSAIDEQREANAELKRELSELKQLILLRATGTAGANNNQKKQP